MALETGVPLGVTPFEGAAMAFGAGVEGSFVAANWVGFGFILVIKNDILAPDMFGSHSKKLYEGKCSMSLLPSSKENTIGRYPVGC
jgi:hypothetical protein